MFSRVEPYREHRHESRSEVNIFLLVVISICLMISTGCVISPRRTLGGGANPTPTPTGSPTPTPSGGAAGKLYVTNVNNNSIMRFDGAASLNGNVAPNAVISGASTQIISPQHIFVDG